MGSGTNSGKAGAYGCLGLTLLIVAIIFIVNSIQSLEENQAGLDWNTITNQIGSLYGPDLQNVEFAGGSTLIARTHDGLQLRLACAFQYRLIEDEDTIKKLYSLVGDQYTPFFSRIGRSVLRNAAAEFDAVDYFTNRTQIDMQMTSTIRTGLNNLGCTMDSFQLISISLPSQFDDAVERTELARQAYTIAVNQRSRLQVEGMTRVNQTRAKATEIVDSAIATAKGLVNSALEQANTTRNAIMKEAEGLIELKSALDMTEAELLDYIYARNAAMLKSKKRVRVDLPTAFTNNV